MLLASAFGSADNPYRDLEYSGYDKTNKTKTKNKTNKLVAFNKT